MGNAPAQARLSAIRITEMVSSRFRVALRSCYLNPAASPIPAASITIIAADGHQLLRTTTTERHGRYAASGLPEGLLTVLVSAVGRMPTASRVTLTGDLPTRQDFVIPDPTQIITPWPA